MVYESVARVVAKRRLPLSYTRDSEYRDRTKDNEDSKRGRFWQSEMRAWSLSSSQQE